MRLKIRSLESGCILNIAKWLLSNSMGHAGLDVISKVLGAVKTRPRAPQARASRGLHSTEIKTVEFSTGSESYGLRTTKKSSAVHERTQTLCEVEAIQCITLPKINAGSLREDCTAIQIINNELGRKKTARDAKRKRQMIMFKRLARQGGHSFTFQRKVNGRPETIAKNGWLESLSLNLRRMRITVFILQVGKFLKCDWPRPVVFKDGAY